MDIQLVLSFVDAVHRTHIHAGAVFHPDARLDDHVRHAAAPLPYKARDLILEKVYEVC
jgi:hypothetical protein